MSVARKPLLLRVKRRRQDAPPGDLRKLSGLSDLTCGYRVRYDLLMTMLSVVIEAQSESSSCPCPGPGLVQSLVALTMDECQAPRKRRKFQLVTTVDDTHSVSTDDLLSKLRSR